MEEETFSGCAGLTSATIPASVEFIAENAFADCNAKLVLTVVEGSYAETWATAHEIAVKALPAA